MTARATAMVTLGALAFAATASGCARERRDNPTADVSTASSGVVVGSLRPGSVPANIVSTLAGYQNNAYAINEGKRLFDSYNCSGCHAHGGGAIGPPLMDQRWIYGSDPANVFATIVEGRPNGMPSFRGKVPDFQVAELVAYVRSMTGLAGGLWGPGRNDSMNVKKPESRVDPLTPVRQETQQEGQPEGLVAP
jgi:cytochrome c oxidase cbb3-type subunit III